MKESLKPTEGLNLSYGTNPNNNTLNLDTTLTNMSKITIGTSQNDNIVGFETAGKIVASRIDATAPRDLLYLNNDGGVGAESGIVFRVGTYNFVTRFDGTNYKIGESNSIFDGTLTEWMRINATEMKISGIVI